MKYTIIILALLCLAACKRVEPIENSTGLLQEKRLQSVTCYSGGSVIQHDENVEVEFVSASAVWYNLSDGTRIRARADCIVKDMK